MNCNYCCCNDSSKKKRIPSCDPCSWCLTTRKCCPPPTSRNCRPSSRKKTKRCRCPEEEDPCSWCLTTRKCCQPVKCQSQSDSDESDENECPCCNCDDDEDDEIQQKRTNSRRKYRDERDSRYVDERGFKRRDEGKNNTQHHNHDDDDDDDNFIRTRLPNYIHEEKNDGIWYRSSDDLQLEKSNVNGEKAFSSANGLMDSGILTDTLESRNRATSTSSPQNTLK